MQKRARTNFISLAGRAGAKAVLVESDESELPFDVVAAKIRRPAPRPGTISRTALVNRLRADRSARAISVVAPGGYGKTTLLAQWAMRDDRTFAWVSLDRRDNDPLVLLRHVAASIHAVAPTDLRTLDALAAAGASIWSTVLPRVGGMIAAADQCVLVLDDAHMVTGSDSEEVLALLAEYVPEGSTLVLSSRVESAFVSKLRATMPLLEIWANDLALTPRESELLLRNAGARLSDGERASLIAKTEGWAAALYLATLSLKKPIAGEPSPDSSELADTISPYVTDYLRSEYLAGLSPERLLFLRRTSVLEKMSGALCDATLARKRSFEELEALKQANLFVIPLDGKGEWYRYHPLFRELLRRELLETEPDLVESLGGRAADWFELHDDPESALEHSLAVGDTDRAARIFAKIALPTYCSGRGATVAMWLEQFDERDLSRYPAVAVHGARVYAMRGSATKAERWLYETERCVRETQSCPRRSLSCELRSAATASGRCSPTPTSRWRILPETSEWRVLALLVYAAAHPSSATTSARTRSSERPSRTQGGSASARHRSSRPANGSSSPKKRTTTLPPTNRRISSPICSRAGCSTPRRRLRSSSPRRHVRSFVTVTGTVHERSSATPATHSVPDGSDSLAGGSDPAGARAYLRRASRHRIGAGSSGGDRRHPRSTTRSGRAGRADRDVARFARHVPVRRPRRGSGLTAAELRLLPLLTTHLSFREIA